MAASFWTPSPLSAARPASLWNINMTRNIISRDSRRHGNTKYYPAGPGDAPVAAYILLLAEAHGLYTRPWNTAVINCCPVVSLLFLHAVSRRAISISFKMARPPRKLLPSIWLMARSISSLPMEHPCFEARRKKRSGGVDACRDLIVFLTLYNFTCINLLVIDNIVLN